MARRIKGRIEMVEEMEVDGRYKEGRKKKEKEKKKAGRNNCHSSRAAR